MAIPLVNSAFRGAPSLEGRLRQAAEREDGPGPFVFSRRETSRAASLATPPRPMRLLTFLRGLLNFTSGLGALVSRRSELFSDHTKVVSFEITSAFEGGSPASLQTADDGIVSYGMHQATLRSGALLRVIERYVDRSRTSVAAMLSTYFERLRSKDITLRTDQKFLTLLRKAAEEPAMSAAQNEIFSETYFRPAVDRAASAGLRSPLAAAIFYDTAVQGGLSSVMKRTGTPRIDGPSAEVLYLRLFLLERRSYLLEVAERKRSAGAYGQAEMLENAAAHRIDGLLALLNSGNLNLTGSFSVNGHVINTVR